MRQAMLQVAVTSRKPRLRSFFELSLNLATGCSLGPGPPPAAVAFQA